MPLLDPASASDYRGLLHRHAPPGVVWALESSRTLRGVLGALADGLARLHQRILDAHEETDPRTADETIDAWERAYGIDNSGLSLADRQAALTSVVAARGGQSPSYYEKLAEAQAGDALVEEDHGFRVGQDRVGRQHLGTPARQHAWVLWTRSAITLALEELKPAHTLVAVETQPHGNANHLAFDGTDDALFTPEIVAHDWHQLRGFSVACWFRTSTADAGTIFAAVSTATSCQNRLYVTNGQLHYQVLDDGNNLLVDVGGPSTVVDDGNWHFVVVRDGDERNGERLILELDHSDTDAADYSRTSVSRLDAAWVGASSLGGDLFTGDVAELAVFARAVDGDTRDALWNGGATSTAPWDEGASHWWLMGDHPDDATGPASDPTLRIHDVALNPIDLYDEPVRVHLTPLDMSAGTITAGSP